MSNDDYVMTEQSRSNSQKLSTDTEDLECCGAFIPCCNDCVSPIDHCITVHEECFKRNCCTGKCRTCWLWISFTLIVSAVIGMIVSLFLTIRFELMPFDESFGSIRLFATDMPHPTVVLCNSNQLRKSFIAEKVGTDLFNLMVDFPTSWDKFTDKMTHLDTFETTKFLSQAVQLKDNFIVGCKWPDGSNCSHKNFETKWTDVGLCYAINEFKKGTPTYDSPLEITVNLEVYDNFLQAEEPSSLTVSFLKSDGDSLIAESSLEVYPGTLARTAVHHIKTVKPEGGCACKKANKDKKICKADFTSQSIKNSCGCSSYTGGPSSGNTCKTSKYLACVPKQKRKISKSNTNCAEKCEEERFEAELTTAPLNRENVESSPELAKLLPNIIKSNKLSTTLDRAQLNQICQNFLSTLSNWTDLTWPNSSLHQCGTDKLLSRFSEIELWATFLSDKFVSLTAKLQEADRLNQSGSKTNVSWNDNYLKLLLVTTEQFLKSSYETNTTDLTAMNLTELTNCLDKTKGPNNVGNCTVQIKQLLSVLKNATRTFQAKSNDLNLLRHQLETFAVAERSELFILSMITTQTQLLSDSCHSYLEGNQLGLLSFLSEAYGNSVIKFEIYFSKLNMLIAKRSGKLNKLQSQLNRTEFALNDNLTDTIDCISNMSDLSLTFLNNLKLQAGELRDALLSFSIITTAANTKSKCCDSATDEKESLIKKNFVKLLIYFQEEIQHRPKDICCNQTNTKGESRRIHNKTKTGVVYDFSWLLAILGFGGIFLGDHIDDEILSELTSSPIYHYLTTNRKKIGKKLAQVWGRLIGWVKHTKNWITKKLKKRKTQVVPTASAPVDLSVTQLTVDSESETNESVKIEHNDQQELV